MQYEVKKLQLLQPLKYSTQAADTGESMTRYITKVSKKDMYPNPQDYLTEPCFCGFIQEDGSQAISVGTYAFLQFEKSTSQALTQAAEALWLECVWQEFTLTDDKIYLRELNHGTKTVCQLFRQIEQ